MVGAVPAGGADAGDGGWYRIAFAGRITPEDRAAVDARGARAVDYWPHHSYLAWLDQGTADRVRDLERVTAVEALSPAQKIDPHLGRAEVAGRYTIQVYGGALDAALGDLEELVEVARVRPAQPDGALMDVLATAAPAALLRMAMLPQVRYIGPAPVGPVPLDEISNQIMAGNRRGGDPPEPGYEDWLDRVGLSGEGERVSVVDTGVDPHPDFQDRLVARVEYSRTVAEPLDVGHGTHVAGIVGAKATEFPGVNRVRDNRGHLYGLGVAPEVEILDQNALAVTSSALLCNVIWPPQDWGWERLTQDALDHDTNVYNASWWTCEATGGGYIESARIFDILSRNADWRTEDEFEPFTFVFSAGNSGEGRDDDDTRITSPAEAKNLITVAASTNARAGADGREVASFSSRGFAVDGRVVPTVTAPGANIMSTRAFTATAICGVPPSDSFALYASCSGTSMAAPHATGAVALLREWWRVRQGRRGEPSPAMTRALLVNTAEPVGPGNHIPNRDEGWGRIHLGNLFNRSTRWVLSDERVVFQRRDDSHTVTVRPDRPGRPLRVTVAWSDAPGAAGADPALVNDLDLVVERMRGGQVVQRWRGNVLRRSRSVSGGRPDRRNNIENVFLPQAGRDTYRITIRAHNLPGDGVPGNRSRTDQDFALVVQNARTIQR
jgi:subtilisin family serine protease